LQQVEKRPPAGAEDKKFEVTAGRTALSARARVARVLVVVVAIASVVAVAACAPSAPRPRARQPAGPPATLEFVPVDDDVDAFAPPLPPLPSGVAIFVEGVPVGMGKTAARHYARIVQSESETLDQTLARVRPWFDARFATSPLPAGDRLVFGLFYEVERDGEKETPVGWRTHIVRSNVIVSQRDVIAARAVGPGQKEETNAYVSLELSGGSTVRFWQFTRDHVGSRLAILVDDRLQSAPVRRSGAGTSRSRWGRAITRSKRPSASRSRSMRWIDCARGVARWSPLLRYQRIPSSTR
jgi:hypothetical protein